jgi:hypothetical protein
MSPPDEYSTFCEGEVCGMYNVRGYCEGCLIKFFNYLMKKRIGKLSYDNFDELWDEFIEVRRNE